MTRLSDALSLAPLLPGVALHEATHAAAALLLGGQHVDLTLEHGRPMVNIDWSRKATGRAVQIAHLAPTLCTPLAIGVAILLAVGMNRVLPGYWRAVGAVLLMSNTVVYIWPSAEDIHPEGQ